MRLLREEVWKTGASSKLNRVSVRSVPGLAHPMVYVWSRLLIVGGDHLRLHEELTFSGGEMKPDGFRRESVLRNLEKLMDSSHPYDDIPEHAFGIFSDLEKEELKRDLSALRARLEQIPDEREKEVASIEKHYSDAKALTFPIAVVFLVPETASWGCRT